MKQSLFILCVCSVSLFACQDDKEETASDTSTSSDTATTDTATGENGQECYSLSIDDCETVENCAVLGGIPITPSEDEMCYYEGEAQAYGCIDMNDPCPPAVVYAYEPDTSNLVMFTYGCLPHGWESVGLLTYEVCDQ
ncbi:MAG: hypothetical protein CMK59_12935 [Proteobacteria bacterium]|nr:hypothetical protein [Pseudomonadota bacterium]